MDKIEQARKILRSDIPWLELDIPFDIDAWKMQAKEAESHYISYRESYGFGWSGCCLHGLDTDKIYTADNYGYEEYNAPYSYTDLSYRCPAITDFWKHIFPAERYTRIRFMKLNPWGSINFHSDGSMPEDIDPLTSILPINIAISHPANCQMLVEDKIVPWSEGKIFMINIGKSHAVFNRSSKPRVHMIANIILGKYTNEFCDMLERCYTKQYGQI